MDGTLTLWKLKSLRLELG